MVGSSGAGLLGGDFIRSVIGERDIAQERGPVEFDQPFHKPRSRRRARPAQQWLISLAGRSGVANPNIIAPLEGEGTTAERTIHRPRAAGNNVFKVVKLAGVNGVPEGIESGEVYETDPVLQDDLAVRAGFVG